MLITSTAATVITAGWLNPLNAFSDGITPEITADNKAVKATISYRHFPSEKNSIDKPRIEKIMAWSDVNLFTENEKVPNIYEHNYHTVIFALIVGTYK